AAPALRLAYPDDPIERGLAERPADCTDELDGELCVGIGKTRVPRRREAPESRRPPDPASQDFRCEQAGLRELQQLLPDGLGGDTERPREICRAQRPLSLDQAQQPVGARGQVSRAHAWRVARPTYLASSGLGNYGCRDQTTGSATAAPSG